MTCSNQDDGPVRGCSNMYKAVKGDGKLGDSPMTPCVIRDTNAEDQDLNEASPFGGSFSEKIPEPQFLGLLPTCVQVDVCSTYTESKVDTSDIGTLGGTLSKGPRYLKGALWGPPRYIGGIQGLSIYMGYTR